MSSRASSYPGRQEHSIANPVSVHFWAQRLLTEHLQRNEIFNWIEMNFTVGIFFYWWGYLSFWVVCWQDLPSANSWNPSRHSQRNDPAVGTQTWAHSSPGKRSHRSSSESSNKKSFRINRINWDEWNYLLRFAVDSGARWWWRRSDYCCSEASN